MKRTYSLIIRLIVLTFLFNVTSAQAQDTTRPTVEIGVPSGVQGTGTFDVTITFSESVTGFSHTDLTLSDPRNSATATTTAGTGSQYTVTINIADPENDKRQNRYNLNIQVPKDVAHDSANNGNTKSQTVKVPIDTGRPVVLIRAAETQVGPSFVVEIDFGEPVTGYRYTDLKVFTKPEGSPVYHPDWISKWRYLNDGTTYSVRITPEFGDRHNITVHFQTDDDVAEDAAGNPNYGGKRHVFVFRPVLPPSDTQHSTLIVDVSDPPTTPAITASISVPSNLQHGAFKATVTFSQAVTGFEQSELSVSGAGASITAWNPQTGGQRYTATITPTTGGEVELSVAADVATETNGAATPVTVVIWPEDVDRDGYIDNEDLYLVASHFGRNPTGDLKFYDVNRDGNIDTNDFRWVVNWLWRPMIFSTAAPTAAATSYEWLQRIKALNIENPEFQELLQSLEQQLPMPAPKGTALLANYPNPFNPETWIPYRLAKSADVTVTIYAVNGEVIRSLPLGPRPAGNYLNRARAAYWDGKNALGEQVTSGIYFYTLTAGNFSATRKMLIAK